MLLLLIDGSYLARSRYEAGGNVTGGFVKKLFDLIVGRRPDRIAVAWDTPSGAQARRRMDKRYKANRHAPPPEFLAMVREVREILPLLGVTQYESLQGEGDDVIATVADGRLRTLIYSADKDLLQLVSDRRSVRVIKARPGRDDTAPLDEAGAAEVLGFAPSLLHSYLSLVGDSSDNVKGVPRVGPVGALALLEVAPSVVEVLLGEWHWSDAALRDAALDEIREAVDLVGGTAGNGLRKVLQRVEDSIDDLRLAWCLTALQILPFDALEVTPGHFDFADAHGWLMAKGYRFLSGDLEIVLPPF